MKNPHSFHAFRQSDMWSPDMTACFRNPTSVLELRLYRICTAVIVSFSTDYIWRNLDPSLSAWQSCQSEAEEHGRSVHHVVFDSPLNHQHSKFSVRKKKHLLRIYLEVGIVTGISMSSRFFLSCWKKGSSQIWSLCDKGSPPSLHNALIAFQFGEIKCHGQVQTKIMTVHEWFIKAPSPKYLIKTNYETDGCSWGNVTEPEPHTPPP